MQITATDLDSNTGATNYQLIVTNSVAETLVYDLNGNLTATINATATNTYEWDAENRLTAINEAGTNRSEFTYDGSGRRVQIVEKTNGVAYSAKTFVWSGTELCEERDSTGTTVTKRFFGQGEQIPGTNYYFTRDHLGSIREMTDTGGTIHARYDYDPSGTRAKVSGDMDADFGFTGHYLHNNSGLYLTLYRAYDSVSGRWISRDPTGEGSSLNLYAYVFNNPVSNIDPLGLEDSSAKKIYEQTKEVDDSIGKAQTTVDLLDANKQITDTINTTRSTDANEATWGPDIQGAIIFDNLNSILTLAEFAYKAPVKATPFGAALDAYDKANLTKEMAEKAIEVPGAVARVSQVLGRASVRCPGKPRSFFYKGDNYDYERPTRGVYFGANDGKH